MPQCYSVNGNLVTKEVYEKHNGIVKEVATQPKAVSTKKIKAKDKPKATSIFKKYGK